MINSPDYYTLLGVFRDATQTEIKHAYFEAAQRLHPDKNDAPGETEIFLDVQKAYETLSDAQKRAVYDASLPPEEEQEKLMVGRYSFSRESLVRIGESQLIYAMLEWKPRESEGAFNTPPLNLCLVLDRSTSMQGEKIDMVKASAIHIVRNLRPSDRLSIVTFSDRADVVVPASVILDQRRAETAIRSILPKGGTEIYQGLEAGFAEVQKSLSHDRVNHIILLTDGRTYGDEPQSLILAEKAADAGVGISGFGIGDDWNDRFLDDLTAKSGNNSHYVAEPQHIQEFLERKFKELSNVFAEDVVLEYTKNKHINLNYAFRIQPNEAHLDNQSPIKLGAIFRDEPLRLLLEFEVHAGALLKDEAILLQGSLKYDLPSYSLTKSKMRVMLKRKITEIADLTPPPPVLINALISLNLYRMQEKAQEDVEAGHYDNASRRLKHLATHLLSQGERSMAKTVILEAENLQKEGRFSEEGRKNLKYGTRALLLSSVKGKKS
jgi:Ca-activated chloride channel family protein